MLSKKISIGQVIEVLSGREKGKLFFVIKIIDQDYVLISDGKKRKLDKPKLKKVKHLEICDILNEEVKDRILSGRVITDAFLRAELTKLNNIV